MPQSVPRPSMTGTKFWLDKVLHVRVNRAGAVMHAAIDLGERHILGLLERVLQKQTEKIALGDGADIAALLGDDRNGGKAAFRHAFQRTADRVGIVNIDHFGLWLEKKGYVHMRYLTAARSRPFM